VQYFSEILKQGSHNCQIRRVVFDKKEKEPDDYCDEGVVVIIGVVVRVRSRLLEDGHENRMHVEFLEKDLAHHEELVILADKCFHVS